MALVSTFWSAGWRAAFVQLALLIGGLPAATILGRLEWNLLSGLVLWAVALSPACWFVREWRYRYRVRCGSASPSDPRYGLDHLADWAGALILVTVAALLWFSVLALPIFIMDARGVDDPTGPFGVVLVFSGVLGAPVIWVVVLIRERRKTRAQWARVRAPESEPVTAARRARRPTHPSRMR